MRDKTSERRWLLAGLALLAAFLLWTVLIQCMDVRPAGQNGTNIGFATFNLWFHRLMGVHMGLYVITDWLGLVPVFVCLGFACVGAAQLVTRRSLFKVDPDIMLLGAYYVVVFFFYLLFEAVPINYRPIPIDGAMEASYPSSTTLLVLSVMPTLGYQAVRRCADARLKRAAVIFSATFSAFMVLARLIAGVHWTTDIIGAMLLSGGLFAIYRYAVALADAKRRG